MAKNKSKSLPTGKSINELIEFFDTQDMGEYWDEMPEAEFEVNITERKYLVAIEERLLDKVSEIAKAKHISAEMLINSWLKEKLVEAG